MITATQANKISNFNKKISIKRKLCLAKTKILLTTLKGNSVIDLKIPSYLDVNIILNYFNDKGYQTEIKYILGVWVVIISWE